MLPSPSPIDERRPSLVDRRPLFSSSEGTLVPLTVANAEGIALEVTTASTTKANNSATVVDSAASSPASTFFLERASRTRSHIGSSMGATMMAIDTLRETYLSTLRHLGVVAPPAVTCDGDVIAPTSQDVESILNRLSPKALVQHAMELHCMIQSATAAHGLILNLRSFSSAQVEETGAGNSTAGLQSATSNATVGSTSNVPHPQDGISVPVDHLSGASRHHYNDDAPVDFTVAHHYHGSGGGSRSYPNNSAPFSAETPMYNLHQSLSTMSMNVAPVRVTNEARKSVDDDGSKMINGYVVLDELGKGNFGKVKLAFDTEMCRMVAIKVIRKPDMSRIGFLTILEDDNATASTTPTDSNAGTTSHVQQQTEEGDAVALDEEKTRRKSLRHALSGETYLRSLQREIAVMKKLRHKNIVSLYEVIDDPEAEKLYLVMQYVDKGPIGIVAPDCSCTAIPADTLLYRVNSILAGLQYLHAHGVVHRDIKPENILCNEDGEAFLSDFGVSEFFEKALDESIAQASVTASQSGTKLFMAPELLDRCHAWKGGRSLDMWALGVTIYGLLTGHLPFASVEEVLNLALPSFDRIPEQWMPLMHGLMERDPRKRWSAFKARQCVKQMIAEQQEHLAPDDEEQDNYANELVHTQDPATKFAGARQQLQVGSSDVNNAITPMAKHRAPLEPASGGTVESSSSPLSRLFRPGESRLVVPAPVFGAISDTTSSPAVEEEAQPSSCPSGLNSTQVPSTDRKQQKTKNGTLSCEPLNKHFKLHHAVIIDLNELEGPSYQQQQHYSTASGQQAVDLTTLATSTLAPIADHTLSSLAAPPAVDAKHASAHHESNKFSKRLKELLSEQNNLETQRRLIPSGPLNV